MDRVTKRKDDVQSVKAATSVSDVISQPQHAYADVQSSPAPSHLHADILQAYGEYTPSSDVAARECDGTPFPNVL